MRATETTIQEEWRDHTALIPGYAVALVAIMCAAALTLTAALGPLEFGVIHYRTSQSGVWQIEGQDLANLVLISPILLIGGALQLARKSSSKYFLILTPITLMYTGLSLGIAQEWGNPAYTGNVENYFWLFLVLVIGGLVLLISSLSMFTEKDAPEFRPRGLRIYAGVMGAFLLLFAAMWVSEIVQVTTTGDTTTRTYQAAPTLFWTIRYLDLGVTIPVGLLALRLLLTQPKRAYPIVLLFFGFFVTLGTAVNAMAVVLVVNSAPEVTGSGAVSLVIFPVLGVLAYAGLWYLIKDKLRRTQK